MRNKIFRFLIEKVGKVDQGQLLPRWLITARFILYPLDSFYWVHSGRTGYQLQSDTWIIHGVRYSDQSMLTLAEAKGGIYRITRKEDIVLIERAWRP